MPLGQGTKYPFGLRDVHLHALSGSIYAEGVNLPAGRVLSIAPQSSQTRLEGDDAVVTVHGFDGSGTWELEAGGIGLDALAVMTGGTTSDSGSTPNVVSYMDADSEPRSLPYFGILGRAITAAGGDVIVKVYKAKCTSGPEGEFSQGIFYLSSAGGMLVPDGNGKLYTLTHTESTSGLTGWWDIQGAYELLDKFSD